MNHRLLSILFLLCLLFNAGCDKDLEISETLSPVTPVDADEDAGEWDMIVMTSPDQLAVPVPDAIGSDAYIAELTSIKDEQAKLTLKQKDIIKYWSAGG